MSKINHHRLYTFLPMLLVYFITMFFYYTQTHSLIIKDVENNIENMLLSQRALTHLVADVQKPEINRLKEKGSIDKDYFSPEILSSSYLAKELSKYVNLERKKVGLEPIIFKYAAPNPTNTENRADAYEMNIYKKFQNKEITKYKETITENGKSYLYYAIAGETFEKRCMECHSIPENAPASLLERYGRNNGFEQKVGDLSSIISIKTPLDGIYKENDKNFFVTSAIIFSIFVVLFIISEKIKTYLGNKDKQLQEAHKNEERQIQKAKALESSIEKLYNHVISSQFDENGTVTQVSDALCKLSGYEREELIGKSFCFFKHQDIPEELFIDMWKHIRSDQKWVGEVKNQTKDGKIFWIEAVVSPIDESKTQQSYEAIMRVITAKKTLQEDINRDPLTKLLNRRSFESQFLNERSRAKRDKKFISMMMFDIDFFKQYNDHYGHQNGDIVLQKVAKLLQDSFRRSCDSVFRLGGEEFAVITSHNEIAKLIESAQNLCMHLEDAQIEHIKSSVSPYLSISVGVAIVPYNMEITITEMYELSDKALYKAKENGRKRVEAIEL